MLKLTAVVIRQLQHHNPVASAVIQQSDNDVDDQIQYLLSKAEEHIQEFKKTFVEFHRANWYVDIIEDVTNKIVKYREFPANPPWQP